MPAPAPECTIDLPPVFPVTGSRRVGTVGPGGPTVPPLPAVVRFTNAFAGNRRHSVAHGPVEEW